MAAKILWFFSVFSILAPVLAGAISFKKHQPGSRIIFILVLIAAVPQLLSFYSSSSNIDFTISYNLYTVLEFFLLFLFFYAVLNKKPWKTWMHFTAILYALVMTIFFVTGGLTQRFFYELVALANLLYLFWMLFYIYKQFYLPDDYYHVRHSFFWFFLALMIYAPTTMVPFALYKYLRQNPNSLLQNLWMIQSICNILLYFLFAVGFIVEALAFKKKTV